MEKIIVKGENGYDILIERGLLESAGEYIRKITKANKALVITDTNVAKLYGDRVKKSLEENGFETFLFSFPAGETSKNLSTVTDMIEAMCSVGLTRSDIVIALGGGVTGDLAGFASAIFLRGIDFVQIPTTLLSQVDSSVGGKTGCDLSFGKNLVGAFHNPRLVLIDPDTIKTLPYRYKKDGIGEIIKYALIKSDKLFNKLIDSDSFDGILDDVIYECVDIKGEIVENDFTEKGERMLLNFGHTLGHAIEKYENYDGLAHGEAVGVGMLYITRASEIWGDTEIGTADKIEKLLNKFSLPVKTNANIDELVNIMLYDKKRRGNKLNLVLVKNVGNSFVKALPSDEFKVFFVEGK